MNDIYYPYELTNGLFRTMACFETLEECREQMELEKTCDKANGYNGEYHIFEVEGKHGIRIKQIC